MSFGIRPGFRSRVYVLPLSNYCSVVQCNNDPSQLPPKFTYRAALAFAIILKGHTNYTTIFDLHDGLAGLGHSANTWTASILNYVCHIKTFLAIYRSSASALCVTWCCCACPSAFLILYDFPRSCP